MSRLCEFAESSIGRKVMVAIAGLLLCGFLVTHLAGNLLLLAGEGTFNHYAYALEENPLLPLAEVILFGLFVAHVALALFLKLRNRQARPVPYEMKRSKGGSSWGSATMGLSGVLVLAFLVVHIRTFKFGDKPDGLFQLVVKAFSNPLYSGFYVLAMGGLALHLSHGFQSGFQTLGLHHPKLNPLLRKAGLAFALAVAGGFAFLPLWAFKTGGRPLVQASAHAPAPGALP